MFEAGFIEKRSWNPHNFLIINPLEDSDLFVRRPPNNHITEEDSDDSLDDIISIKTPQE